MSDLIERVDKALDALRHLSYAEEQLEHAIRRAEDEGKEVSVLQWDKDLGSAPVERDEKVLPGVRKLPLERWECNDEMGGDFKMESAKELHIEALIEDELDRIVKEHGLFSSDHEAWAVEDITSGLPVLLWQRQTQPFPGEQFREGKLQLRTGGSI